MLGATNTPSIDLADIIGTSRTLASRLRIRLIALATTSHTPSHAGIPRPDRRLATRVTVLTTLWQRLGGLLRACR